MQIIENTTEFHIEEKTAIAIGKFDGIHRGHKEIFKCLQEAKKEGLKTAVFTFDPSPAAFFSGGNIKELTTKSEKRILFEQMGIDYLVEYPFDKETAGIDPTAYVTEVLLHKMNGACIVAGYDVSFGKGGKGSRRLLEQLSAELGFKLQIIDKLKYEDREISSTYVREEVAKGNMEKVQELLGEAFFVSGVVENGKKLGRRLGMPTTNLYPEEDKLLPPNGVYCSKVKVKDACYNGVTNIGSRPTVEDGNRISVETYLMDFDEEIYGEVIQVELLHFLRPEQRFDDVEQLKRAVLQNIEEAKRYFG
ncbi:MAG: bifunctional riboflavin kinase/FAD synthetase [Lachnospiraceae bacterium]|nr:bifunctional riboflavin kinase/FAD synthetase [Lachnospiraceae bacterium]